MPSSVLEVRCDVSFHDGSHIQQELDIAVGQACVITERTGKGDCLQ